MLFATATSRAGALVRALARVVMGRSGRGQPARSDLWQSAAWLLAWATILAAIWTVMQPWLRDLSTYGFHDWDVESSFRYLTTISLSRYHEFPGWNPYACGGYPAWGYVEGGTTLVSPWLPAYLALPLPLALRVEVLGQALVGALGAYLLAGAFTRSHGARLLVVAVWAVNGRWALQIASGHTWHLAYAWLPWCLYGYEKARLRLAPHGRERWVGLDQALRDGRRRGSGLGWVVLSAASFAMLVYAGGIYPLPHSVLTVGCYATLAAIAQRSPRPLALLAVIGLVGVGLAAPKLLPVLHTFSGDPRLIESTERLDPGAFVTLLTSRDQGFYSRPARVSPYGWHEWGMYISWAGLGALGLGFVLTEGRRQRALKLIGALLVVLGFGAFHAKAPWTLLHEHLPVFRSQHVPSRFLYPAVLVLALVAATGIGRFVTRRARSMPWLDVLLVLGVSLVALDVARVAAQPMKSAMWMVPGPIPEGREFRHSQEPPFHYRKRDWAGPVLLAMMGNTGVLNCYGVPRSAERPIAAVPRGAREYRGEVYVVPPGPETSASTATASVQRWSPNRVTVSVQGATAGSTLVYNMNFRQGWRSDAGPVVALDGLVSVRLTGQERAVTMWYRPPGLAIGLLVGLSTLLLLVASAFGPRLAKRWRGPREAAPRAGAEAEA